MSIQPKTSSRDDLDRTDELPCLDVAVYEAALAESDKALSRTDTWTVKALRDLDELAESTYGAGTAVTTESATHSEAGALTLNVDRILQRIADLEAEVVAAHEANAQLEEHREAIQADRDRHALRIQALEADNARLNEQRELSTEIAERLEKKLREQLEYANTQIDALRAALTAARTHADEELKNHQDRIDEMAAQHAALQGDNRSLQERLDASIALASQRAESLASVQEALGEEKAVASQLTRQFAAKLTEYDKLRSLLDLRNRTVEELTSNRDALNDRLRQEIASGAELAGNLSSTQRNLNEARARLRERETDVAQKDTQLAQLTAQIGELRHAVETAERKTAATQGELAAAALARHEEEARYLELAARLESEHAKTAALDNERIAALAQIQALTEQRDGLLSSSHQLTVRVGEMDRHSKEMAQSRDELAAAHTVAQARIQALTEERDALLPVTEHLASRTAELEQSRKELAGTRAQFAEADAAAQAQIRALVEERDGLLPIAEQLATRTTELEQSVVQQAGLREELAAARAAGQDSTRRLDERTGELAELQARLREHATAIHGLEVAIRARDELAEQLRGQLQTAQDEHAIMGDQLAKARKRVKSLTQEIFQRDHRIAELRTDLAVHTEALAAIRRDVNRIGKDVEAERSEEIAWMLEAVEHDGAAILLTSKMLTLGRTTENDVWLPSKLVSRHHARLLVGPTGVIVEDAGSTNGCFVNGEQVRQHLMHDGDVLSMGDLRYRLHAHSVHDTKVRANVIPIFDRPSS